MVASVEILVAALRSRSLLPADDVYRAGLAGLVERGHRERARLRRRIGRARYRGLLRQTELNRPDEQIARVLGFGAHLTEFAVAPLVRERRGRDRLAHLGAMANLIVSIYDLSLDRHHARLLAGAQDLERLIVGDARPTRTRSFGPIRGDTPFRTLATSYLHEVDTLAREHSPGCRPVLLHRVIRSMYAAEHATQQAAAVPDLALRRKCALPFVVMGLPSWQLGTTATPVQLRWHLRWLYRLGTVFGWVDDWVDLQADLDEGQPNRVARTLRHGATRAADLAERIGDLAASVQLEWEHAAAGRRDLEPEPASLRGALPVGISLWLGGQAMAPRSL